MRINSMEVTNSKDDPLTRIQREIIEVTERENEFRKVHPTYVRKLSESDLELDRNTSNGHAENSEICPPRTMTRAYSTSQLAFSTQSGPSYKSANGVPRRYTPNTNQRGIMQRFIASKGRLNMPPVKTPRDSISERAYVPDPVITPAVATKIPDGKPLRKGFVPVEEKIQKELKDIKDREMELKKQRKKTSAYQLDLSSLDGSEGEMDYESEEEDEGPGKLRPAKSIGELYESLGETSSPSPTDASGADSYASLKPAKSLAELCELGPDERAMAPSSTKLIAKWESLIQQKQESGAA